MIDLVEKLQTISARLQALESQGKSDSDEYRALAEEFRNIAHESLSSGQLRDKEDE